MQDKTGVYLSFPPTGVRLSRIEYQALTMDLPHLCLKEKTTYNEKKEGDETKYTIIKGNGVKEYTKSSLDDVMKTKVYWPELDREKYKNITKFPEEPKQYQYHYKKYNDLIKSDSWMCDETVSLLLNWFETIKDKEKHHRLHFVSSIATDVLINRYRQYKSSIGKASGDEIKDEKNATVEKFRRVLKCDQSKINDSDCIFMVVNIKNNHWCLVCLLNLRTISSNFIDFEDSNGNQILPEGPDANSFQEYNPPCISIFHSMYKSSGSECVDTLIESIRFWLSNDPKINPNWYSFSSFNLPSTAILTEQQKDGSSCGFFAIRNIIGMFVSFESIFPIQMKDLVKNTNPQKYKNSISSIFRKESMKKVRIINSQKSMMFTNHSVAVILRDEVRLLIERLRDIYLYCKKIKKEKMKPLHNKIDETTSIISFVNSIQSINLNSKLTRDNNQINIEKNIMKTWLMIFNNSSSNTTFLL